MLNETLDPKEVNFGAKSLSLRKSCRVDQIPNEIFKNQNIRNIFIIYYLICGLNQLHGQFPKISKNVYIVKIQNNNYFTMYCYIIL